MVESAEIPRLVWRPAGLLCRSDRYLSRQLTSIRTKDLDDLRVLAPQFDKATIVQRLKDTMQTALAPESLKERAKNTGISFSEKSYPNEHDTPTSQGTTRRPCARHRRAALQPRDRHAVLGRGRRGQEPAAQARFRSAQRRQMLRGPEEIRPLRRRLLRGGPVRRWLPRTLEQADLRLRDRRHTGIPRAASSAKITGSTTKCSAPPCRPVFPQGHQLAHAWPFRAAPSAFAVEHLAQFRGGISFCVDLDPRWVIRSSRKAGWNI